MDYVSFRKNIDRLDFIDGPTEADAAIKTVLGVMTSRLDEQRARDFTGRLPDPLDFDALRSHQQGELDVSAEAFVGQISNQFKLNDDESRRLIDTIMRRTREVVGDQVFNEVCRSLPADWQDMMRRF